MPKQRKSKEGKTHEQSRALCCILCLKKADRKATQNQLISIRNYSDRLSTFDVENENGPTGICTNCRLMVIPKMGQEGFLLPTVPNFHSFA